MRRVNLKDPTPMRVVLIATILVGLAQPTLAEQVRRGPRKSQPVPVARTAPDVTAGIPQPSLPPASAKVNDEPLHPFNLPTASRSRMRVCGQKWQGVKMSGRAGDETWREFATKCLTEGEAEKKTKP